ncbi:MAG: IPT/TIG domain-containing protein [Candidatus Neomarinimicrobiota bacterium]
MSTNSINLPTMLKLVWAAAVVVFSGCIESGDDILYDLDNPDPYPAHSETAELDSVVPSSAYPTDIVIIRGSGFDTRSTDYNFVFFGIASATVTTVWADSLAVVVPTPRPIDYFFADTVLVKVALQGSYSWSNEVSFIFKPMAHVYVASEYPAGHPEEKFTQPRGLAFDTDGNMYLMNQRLRAIYKDTPGGVRTVYAFGSTLKVDGGLRMGPDGSLYAAGNGEGLIYRIPPGGGSFEEWTTVPNPWGMDFDRFGNLFVVDNANRHLYRISSDGTTEKVAELPGTAEKAYCRVFGDAVFVNERTTGIIFKLAFTEDSVGEIDTVETTVSGRVNDITFGTDGSMYVSGISEGANALIKVDPSGTLKSVVTLAGDLGFLTWHDKFLYISSLTGPVHKVLMHDNTTAPYYGRGD